MTASGNTETSAGEFKQIDGCALRCCSPKMLITTTLCLAYLGLGACISIHGPTLTALSENINSTIAETSWIFTARSAGYLVGSMLAGVLFDRLNKLILLGTAVFFASISMALVPWGTTLWMLNIFVIFQGIAMGFMDCGGNVICLEVWGSKNNKALQTLHFFFGLGSFIAPTLSEPFLKSESGGSSLFAAHNMSTFNHTAFPSSQELRHYPTSCSILPGPNSFFTSCSIKCPYLANSVLLAVVGIMSLIMSRYSSDYNKYKDVEIMNELEDVKRQRNSKSLEMCLLFVLSLLFFCYIGSEVTYGGLVSPFSELEFGVSQQRSANVASIFWATFSIGRFLSIFAADYLSPMTMILCDLTVSLISLIILVSTKWIQERTVAFITLCFSSALLGLGMSSIFPAGVAWIGCHLKLSGRYASIFVIGSAFGEMVLPIAGAYLMELSNYYIIYFLAGINVFSALLVFVMKIIADRVVGSGGDYSEIPESDGTYLPTNSILATKD